MNCQQNTSNNNEPLVYGFLCEHTNTFYAFDTYQQYQEFLEWLQTESQSHLGRKAT